MEAADASPTDEDAEAVEDDPGDEEAGTPGAGATPADADAEGGGEPGVDPDYLAELQAWVEQHKRYPRQAQRRREEGTASVWLRLDGDGNVVDYRIEEGSGSRILDRAVEEMVERADPFPAPSAIDRDEFEIVVPVTFSIR